MRTSSDLHNFLQSKGIDHEICLVEHAPRTGRRAAALLGVDEGEVAKTVIAVADGVPIALLVPADKMADFSKISALIGAKDLRMAEPAEVVAFTDYVLGATPPIGHAKEMRTIVDPSVVSATLVYCGGGEPNAILKIRPEDVVAVSGAVVADISKVG